MWGINMSNRVLIDPDILTDIADSIRAKTGGSASLAPSGMASAIRGIVGKEVISWHQCPEAVRNFIAAAQAAYPSNDNVTVINDYAPARGNEADGNTKPVGYTVDGTTFYNNRPTVAEPFATTNKAGTLMALDGLRWMNTTSAAVVSGETYPRGKNCRDLGGWSADGGTIRYGLLFRGGEPNPVDAEMMVKKLGIMTEVQLLPVSEQAPNYKMKSVWGIDWAGNDTQSDSVYTINDSKTLWRKLVEPIIDSVIHHKPVLFHCGVGADRTGIIATALESILGMSKSDIDIEYELTNFSTGWQDLPAGIYRARTYTAYQAMVTAVNNVPLADGLTASWRNRWVSFLLTCGISISKINAFRAAMIDGTPETITVTLPDYTITSTLTNVSNSNAASTVESYGRYVAALTPDAGYLIGSVQVTMGGVDITNQVFNGTPATMRHSIANNLTNCVTNNAAETIVDGETYTATLSANTGYTIQTVTIIMGGIDVSNYYSNGIINIPSVTGNIVITATATETARENLLTMNDGLINKRFNATNTISTANGYFVTDHFAFSGGGLRIVKGNLNMGSLGTNNYGNCRIGFYDANKTFIDAAYIGQNDGNGTNKYLGFPADGDDLVDADLSTYTGIADWSAVKFIRMTLSLNNETTIGSVSDVLNSGMKIYAE